MFLEQLLKPTTTNFVLSGFFKFTCASRRQSDLSIQTAPTWFAFSSFTFFHLPSPLPEDSMSNVFPFFGRSAVSLSVLSSRVFAQKSVIFLPINFWWEGQHKVPSIPTNPPLSFAPFSAFDQPPPPPQENRHLPHPRHSILLKLECPFSGMPPSPPRRETPI